MERSKKSRSLRSSATPDVQGRRRSARTSLNGCQHLYFDQKFHPMDDVTRPAHARKRRRLMMRTSSDEEDDHRTILDADEDEDDDPQSDQDSDEEDGSDTEEEDIQPSSTKNISQKRRRSYGSRQSERLLGRPSPNYNCAVHPQEHLIPKGTGAVKGRRGKKRKISEISSHPASNSVLETVESGGERNISFEDEIAQYTQAWGNFMTTEALTERNSNELIMSYTQAWEALATQEAPEHSANLYEEHQVHLAGHDFMHEMERNEEIWEIPDADLTATEDEEEMSKTSIRKIASSSQLGSKSPTKFDLGVRIRNRRPHH